jgi:predicted nucleic acid-binding Zn finger protein
MGRDTYTYEGEPVATPKWVDYPAIALTTGENTKFKFRIIPKEDIIEIDGSANTFKAEEVKERIFSVTGSKGDTYIVTVGEKYKSCTCQAFMFRRNCKHIVGVS